MNIKPDQIPDEVVEAAMSAYETSPVFDDAMRYALAAALPVLLVQVGRVVDGFHDALGGSVHVAEWTGDEPPLGATLYTLPTQDTLNADQ